MVSRIFPGTSEAPSGYPSFLSVAVIKHSNQKQPGGGRGRRNGLFHLTLPGHHLSLKEVRRELKAGMFAILPYYSLPGNSSPGRYNRNHGGWLPVDSCGFMLSLLLHTQCGTTCLCRVPVRCAASRGLGPSPSRQSLTDTPTGQSDSGGSSFKVLTSPDS